MLPKQFVHLHLHTDYSLLDGACKISGLISRAAEFKMPAVAVTDHGNLFATVELYKAAQAQGIKPIVGCEMYVSQQGRLTRSDSDHYNHLVLLCANDKGYSNLIKLVSAGYLEGFYYKPRVDKELLARHSEGLIALSGCLRGEIAEALVNEKPEIARKAAYDYLDIFGKGNFFLEIQDQGLEQEKKINPELAALSSETGVPLVATNDCHYLCQDDCRAHDVLLCIQTGRTVGDTKRLKFTGDQFYLKSYEEMMSVFGEIPEAVWRSAEIAERCETHLGKVDNPFPDFAVPPGETPDSYFAKVAREGFEARRPRLEELAGQGKLRRSMSEYVERLEREIKTIQQMKFPGYFLIVWDFVRYAKQHNIPVGPGRGSAAGSLVSYSLGITDIDPLQFNLLFERFLNPERISMPDIDIDFCQNRRGEVINYVTQKYGRENVAQIITFGTMAAKAVIKDSARALEMPYGDADRLAKLVPPTLNITLEEALEQSEQLASATKDDPKVGELMEVARRLEGMVRHASTHAAGVVISPRPLTDVVPLYKTNKDEIVTQFDMNGLEKIGLLKMDFLGLTTLTVVDEALKLIEQTTGQKIDIDRLPFDDRETYELFSKGLTSGVFQFESGGMRDILRRYKPTSLEDLTALNALYRPGPLQGGMVDDFIARKHGLKPIVYDLPVLEEFLAETYGVIVYQEQVMQIANCLAGFSLGQADLLRRAMGKKKAEEMAAQREMFVDGAVARGFPKKNVVRIFDLMEQFAGYGFNKSHSAAYAFLAFVTAYLKAHYKVQFVSALLTSETGNTDKVVQYIKECREMGIAVLPPDIQTSAWSFTPDGDSIRFGLGAVKNVGQHAVESIVSVRAASGTFRSMHQLCEEVDLRLLNKRVFESLVKAGAFDSLGPSRSQHFAMIEPAMESAQKVQRDRSSGQHGLFGGPETAPTEVKPPNLPEWSDTQRLAGEKEVLGFYISGHPLRRFEDKLRDLGTKDTSQLANYPNQSELSIGGVLTSLRTAKSKKGDLWASAVLEDLEGSVSLLIFPESYRRYASVLQNEAIVYIKGKVQQEDSAPPKVVVAEVQPLESVQTPVPTGVVIRVRLGLVGEGIAKELYTVFQEKAGETPVRIEIERERDFHAILEPEQRIRPDSDFLSRVRKLCGTDALRLV